MLLPPTEVPAAIVGLSPFNVVISPEMLPEAMLMGGLTADRLITLERLAGTDVIGFLTSSVIWPLDAIPVSKKFVGRSSGSYVSCTAARSLAAIVLSE